MARGVTEEQVHLAADVLVSNGERPTVERVRQYLGTGSASTLVKWLDTWWQTLGSRLATNARQMALPEAPDSVAALAGQLWHEALRRAQALAESELAEARRALEAQQAALIEERQRTKACQQVAQSAVTSAQTERDIAIAQLAESRQLVAQLQVQAADLAEQRDGAQVRLERLEAAAASLAERVDELQVQAQQARAAFESDRRAMEDRAHREVDLARQAVKELRREMAAALKVREARLTAAQEARDLAAQEAAKLQGEAAALRARALALEEQLAAQRTETAALPRPRSREPGKKGRAPKRSHPTKANKA